MDAFENVKLMNSLHINLKRSRTLQELTLCGYRMTEVCAAKLNSGLMQCKSIKKVRLNFCIYKRKIFMALMPCLTQNNIIEEINLAANDLNDDYCYLINKLIASH